MRRSVGTGGCPLHGLGAFCGGESARTGRRGLRGPQCKWGRHRCRPHSHRRVDDPARDASGEPSASSAWGHAWRPMSSLSLPAPCGRPARDLSPALAPASGLASGWLCVPPRTGVLRFPPPRASAWPRPRPFTVCKNCGLGALAVSAALALRPGSWPVRCHRVAPILELSRLAFGRGLLHAVSRSARGQMPPPSLG
jgi:hypothetical protein